MREILFKAKRLDNGEWVEGYYAFARELLCQENVHVIFTGDGFNWYYKIDPSTLCQYTGLTDKNGKKVFEGDRMETKYKDEDEVFVMKGTVVYIKNSFMVLLDDGWNILEDLDAIYLAQARVIGNIHDKENQDE